MCVKWLEVSHATGDPQRLLSPEDFELMINALHYFVDEQYWDEEARENSWGVTQIFPSSNMDMNANDSNQSSGMNYNNNINNNNSYTNQQNSTRFTGNYPSSVVDGRGAAASNSYAIDDHRDRDFPMNNMSASGRTVTKTYEQMPSQSFITPGGSARHVPEGDRRGGETWNRADPSQVADVGGGRVGRESVWNRVDVQRGGNQSGQPVDDRQYYTPGNTMSDRDVPYATGVPVPAPGYDSVREREGRGYPNRDLASYPSLPENRYGDQPMMRENAPYTRWEGGNRNVIKVILS